MSVPDFISKLCIYIKYNYILVNMPYSLISQSLEDYAEQCPGIVCDWELDTGMAPSCPAKSSYKGCASVCQDTCQNLDAEAK